jgi:iron complex outermembrane recepter protein
MFRIRSSNRRWAAGAASVIALTAAAATGARAADASAASESTVDEVIVTGTRQADQTQFSALSSVDVFSAKSINSTVSSQLDQTLAQLVPSFDVKRLPASDGLEFIRPATLDGLSPDMTLVMVNGKRFHRSAFLGSNGSQASDLAQIPTFAVSHVEVLRDGASAQYGSDAIAGVVNIILDDKPGFAVYGQGSRYYAGDGAQAQVGGRGGVALPGGGHLVVTAEYSKSDETSRTHQRPDAIAFQAANPTLNVQNPVQRWGNPDLRSTKLAFDAAEPVGSAAEVYAFGTFGQGRGVADINWRNPSTNSSIYKTTTIFPGFDLRSIYPAGFTPHEGIDYNDLQLVTGVRHDQSAVFTWDLSGSYGRNDSRFFLNNSINASLGPDSPTAFNLGHMIESEFDLNADGVYKLKVPVLADPINIAFGAERRAETFQIKAGDPASYAVGAGAAAGLAPESNGFPGFSPQQAGSWTQASYAGYVDVQAPITHAWQAEFALRDESYDDFGNTFNYKVATRYELTPELALRGSYSTGFKAPTPGQLNSTSTSQGLDTVTLQLFTNGRLSPLNPVAQYFGAKALKPEESKTLSGGLVWKTGFGFTGSVDVYQIDVSKRFSTSPTYTITDAIRQQLIALGVNGASSFTAINFFTNDFDTTTRGVDVVGSYGRRLGPGRLDLTAAYSYTDTKVTSGSLATAANYAQKIVYEQGVPQHNATATATYGLGKVSLMGRLRYYGPWTDSSGNSTGDIFQRFGGVAFVDVAVTYNFTPGMLVRVGAENVGNTYPDKATYQASRGIDYSRNAPYDTNGGDYYVRFEAKY